MEPKKALWASIAFFAAAIAVALLLGGCKHCDYEHRTMCIQDTTGRLDEWRVRALLDFFQENIHEYPPGFSSPKLVNASLRKALIVFTDQKILRDADGDGKKELYSGLCSVSIPCRILVSVRRLENDELQWSALWHELSHCTEFRELGAADYDHDMQPLRWKYTDLFWALDWRWEDWEDYREREAKGAR
jgi:hypothetical protein